MGKYFKQSFDTNYAEEKKDNKSKKEDLKKLVSYHKSNTFGSKKSRLSLKKKIQQGTATTEDKLNYRKYVKARQLNIVQKPLKGALYGAAGAAALAANVALPGAGAVATGAAAIAANKAAKYASKGIKNTVGWNKGSGRDNADLANKVKKGTQLDTLQRDRLKRSEKLANKVQEKYKKKQLKIKAKELAKQKKNK
jgi:hypothetical protein